jgi:alpha-galactosidase
LNRRNFIKLTGASAGALLISNYLKAEGRSAAVMQMPDEVKILSGNEYQAMLSSDARTWTYKDVVVKLGQGKDAVAVYVQSPTAALSEIQLSWKFASAKQARVLGDAWERTYADVGFHPIEAAGKMPWYCVVHGEHDTNCFGVKTGAGAFCHWQMAEGRLDLHLDTRNGGGGTLLGSRTLHAADIVATKNRGGENVFATTRRFCKLMCDKPLTVAKPVYGINDWYFAYGNNSAELILEHTALLAPLATSTSNRPFSVIDDGWSQGTDYTRTNDKFPDMPKLVAEIGKLGMRPGLWTRPLLPKPGEKQNLLIPGRGDVLDPTLEENTDYVKSIFRLYQQWGFELVKHDYTTFDIFGRWGKEMSRTMTDPGWQFNDKSKTNAEIILHLYRSIREASGNMYLIGCNTISHLSAGLFELYRTGDDTSGKEWKRTKEMGVNTMGYRMVQHRTFYEVDGDCVGLTDAVPWEKNKQWMQLLAQSSAPLFISAQPAAVGAEQKSFIKQSFTQAAGHQPIGEPLDWLENEFPARWKLDGKTVTFNWD